MTSRLPVNPPERRLVLKAAWAGGLAVAGSFIAANPGLCASDADDAEEHEIIRRLTGGIATESPRVRLEMPAVFGNGYSVPLTLAVDSPMTEADYVRRVVVVAPRNPIVAVVNFHFTPQSGKVAISTRIRLAAPQNVLAVAEMSDSTLVMARTWVKVDVDGCT